MKTLIINAGSSSLKYTLFENEKAISKGIADRIGSPESVFRTETSERSQQITDYNSALSCVFDELIAQKKIKHLQEIKAVGHRVVHGGSKFKQAVIITPRVKKAIVSCFSIAPLHNPPNYAGIVACEKSLPHAIQVAVFDTAFHQTIPKNAYTYAIPRALSKKYSIRKYGFHGTSHQYVCQEAARILKKPLSKLKLISCHLGNGSSIAAVKNGKCIDTSMGFTPLEGLVMGTRCGDIDPAVLLFLMKHERLSIKEMDTLLNKKSGVFGISGISQDFRGLLASKKKEAKLAIDVFVYRLAKYIGAYITALGGCNAIIFTAGIGENSPEIRKKVSEYFKYAGLSIDLKKNRTNQKIISLDKSEITVLVIPTNEEQMILFQTQALFRKKRKEKIR